MKKYLLLFIYIIICFFIDISILDNNLNPNSIIDLLFLNFSFFDKYGIDKLNFQLIIHFYFLYILILNIFISNFNEIASFLKLVIYRNGTYKTLRSVIFNNTARLLIIILFINIIIIFQLFIYNITFNNYLLTFLILNLYLIRYFIIIIFIIINQYLCSIKNTFSKALVKNSLLTLLIILIDSFLELNIITFSNNLYIESIYLIIYILLFIISLELIKLKIKNGGINDNTR